MTKENPKVFSEEGYRNYPHHLENPIIEIDLDKIIGLDEEERDDSVNYYQPFCIVGEQDGKQVQIFLNWDNLITLALKIKPYLESYEARNKMNEEMEKEYSK